MKAIPVALAAVALASCMPGSLGVTARPIAYDLAGEVELSALPSGWAVSASLGDVLAAAAVSLIDPATGNTIKTALTNGTGAFSLSGFESTFAPATGALYYLEAAKGLGGHVVGRNAARLRTLVRWTGTAWASITAGTVKVGTASTALAAMYGLKLDLSADKRIAATDMIGQLSGAGFAPVNNATAAEYNQARALVVSLLAGDRDPLASLGYNADSGTFYQKIEANLAPDDFGDPAVTHDYLVTKGGVQSTFVWIPVFTAYQLIVPSNCGAENAAKPVGYWVASQPSAGTQDNDWAREQFGGFYAGKYEASRSDAAPGTTGAGYADATAGSGGTLKVARYCVPWAGIDWDGAALACMAYDSHCHLVRDEEFAALAIWATINGLRIGGNTQNRLDAEDSNTTFQDDPTFGTADDRALTGTGQQASWSGATNLTAHTGTTAGVFDLVGNVWEWQESLGAAQGSGNYVLQGVTLAIAAPSASMVSALSTDVRLRRLAVPGATLGNVTVPFSSDYMWIDTAKDTKAVRGAHWFNATNGGIWAISFEFERTRIDQKIGFRPALRY
ncbi:MAG: hypothetical protein FJZ01_06115 [Candidatus Sericytochromatia bacterium]|nr:hypothetical protein [Candidatus Tanganyikabacteria bacterium]